MPILHHHGAGHTGDWLTGHCRAWHADREESGFHWHLARLKDLDGRLPGRHSDESLGDTACSIMTQIESQRQFALNTPMQIWTQMPAELMDGGGRGVGSLTAIKGVGRRPRGEFRDNQSICARLNSWLL